MKSVTNNRENWTNGNNEVYCIYSSLAKNERKKWGTKKTGRTGKMKYIAFTPLTGKTNGKSWGKKRVERMKYIVFTPLTGKTNEISYYVKCTKKLILFFQ